MRRILCGLFLLAAATLWGQGADPTATPQAGVTSTPVPPAPKKWTMAAVPWDAWFKANPYDVTVESKEGYVYFMWNAKDFEADFEVKDKKQRLAEAALQLVSQFYPADGKDDLVKVDITYVLERNHYGEPLWDNLQQAAHFEFLKSKAQKLAKSKKDPTAEALQKAFSQFVIY